MSERAREEPEDSAPRGDRDNRASGKRGKPQDRAKHGQRQQGARNQYKSKRDGESPDRRDRGSQGKPHARNGAEGRRDRANQGKPHTRHGTDDRAGKNRFGNDRRRQTPDRRGAGKKPGSGFARPRRGYEEVTADGTESSTPMAAGPTTDARQFDADRVPRGAGPELPDDIEFSDLDPEARRELRSLSKGVAELVGRHLVATGLLLDEDPDRALEHARYARTRASRVAVVREAAGVAAYQAGEWAEALGELRAVRRMTGAQIYLPLMVDCERALGRAERALELVAEAPADLPADVAVELRIVGAGARRDLGQLDAAVVALQGPDLDAARRDPWSARLFYAYADNLQAAGRTEDAIRWFLNAAEADLEEETDAAERATSLSEQ